MSGLISYVLKASAATTILYLIFLLLFRKDTFYHRNRWYLVFTLVFPLILPAFRFSSPLSGQVNMPAILSSSEALISDPTILPGISEGMELTEISRFFTWIYIFVVAIFLARIIVALLGTFKIIRYGSMVDSGFPKIVITDLEHAAFSFFPYVVLSKKTYMKGDLDDILAHESNHVLQVHTMDLLLYETVKALQWFNPLIYFIRKSIVLNHEYIADQFLLKNPDHRKEYQYKLLDYSPNTRVVPLAHNFSSFTKNRIIMINTKPTPKIARWKNLIILPVMAILTFFLSCESTSLQTDRQKPALSDDSQMSIRKYIQENVTYPKEALNSLDTGMVYVVVRMDKGGVIEECRPYVDINDVDAPMLGEVVIAGYKPPDDLISTNSSSERATLITECERVAYLMQELDVPEWEESSISFALVFHFRMI